MLKSHFKERKVIRSALQRHDTLASLWVSHLSETDAWHSWKSFKWYFQVNGPRYFPCKYDTVAYNWSVWCYSQMTVPTLISSKLQRLYFCVEKKPWCNVLSGIHVQVGNMVCWPTVCSCALVAAETSVSFRRHHKLYSANRIILTKEEELLSKKLESFWMGIGMRTELHKI